MTINRARRKADTVTNVTVEVVDKNGRHHPASKPKRKAPPAVTRAREIVRPLVERGDHISAKKLAEQHDISPDSFERALHVERALHDTIGNVSPAALEEARIAMFKRQIEAEFDQRVVDEVRRRLNEILPIYRQDQDRYRLIVESRKGYMDRKTYNGILMRLHPDHGWSA